MFGQSEKNRQLRRLNVLLTATLALSLAGGVAQSWAQEDEGEYGEAWVRIEINATDGDAGFQGMADADGWRKLKIKDPDRKKIYKVLGTGSVLEQGLTENFFESAEPPCDEQPLENFLDLFQAGEYRFRGRTTDEEKLEGESFLTHDLPGAPEMLSPTGAGIDAANPVVISWVAGDTLGNCPPGNADVPDPGDVDLFGYEVIVGRELPEPLLEYVIGLPATATSVTIPAEFMEQNGVYKYEIIAIEARLNEDLEEERGNQTISEAFFCTIGVNPCELPE